MAAYHARLLVVSLMIAAHRDTLTTASPLTQQRVDMLVSAPIQQVMTTTPYQAGTYPGSSATQSPQLTSSTATSTGTGSVTGPVAGGAGVAATAATSSFRWDALVWQRLLGAGANGKADLYVLPNGDRVAVKTILLNTDDDVMAEVRALEAAERHPNVIRYLAHTTTDTELRIAMEYASDGDLATALKTRGGPFTVQEAVRIMRDVLSGVHYLHDVCRVVHRDIKPENILLSGTRPLLGDLGLGRGIGRDSSRMATHAGTPAFMAPEVLNWAPYDKSVDVYSCGVTLFCLLSGPRILPFTTHADVLSGNVAWSRLSAEATSNAALVQLLRDMMSVDPAARPSAAKAMARLGMLLPD